MPSAQPTSFASWLAPLRALCDGIRARAREALAGPGAGVQRPAAQGEGDVSFALDLACEAVVDEWLAATAARGPLSLLTEDRGWRHRGPDGSGGWRELPGFDHGGPRIGLDPVDGTRNLMAELRSAWTVVSFAGPGIGEPRYADVSGGIVAELPTARGRGRRVLWAERGGECRMAEHGEVGEPTLSVLRTDPDDRSDHGYFPVFRYDPRERPAVAALEAAFFARLAEHEGADQRSIYDDQYISNGGQLVLLALGTYRMIADPRALLAGRRGVKTTTSKPYDVAGALRCAEAAGAVLRGADGAELDFPLDARTPVHFLGWVNEATRRRLEPHWLAALAAVAAPPIPGIPGD